MSTSAKITPSYYGYVGSTNDALLIIQAVIQKQLDPIPRRPHERERPSLIKSGNVFVFMEESSGIKRWTDGIAWSPSRILGRFLVYRELDKQSLSEKDDKKKKKRKTSFDQDPLDQKQLMPPAQQLLQSTEGYSDNDFSKQLVGSLVNTYVFKDQGLIKKTLSLTLPSNSALGKAASNSAVKSEKSDSGESDKHTIHLISYYNADDVLNGKLHRPSVTDLKDLVIPNELWSAIKESSLGGKIPIEDEAFYFLDTNYQLQNMSSLSQQPALQHSAPASVSGAAGSHLQHNSQGNIHPPPPHHQSMIQPGFFSQQKYPPSQAQMHILPIPLQQQSADEQQQQQQQQQQPNAGTVLPPPSQQGSTELTFVNPFTGNSQHSGSGNSVTGANNTQNSNYGFGATAGSGLPYYNTNYMNPPPPQPQQYSHNQYSDNNNAGSYTNQQPTSGYNQPNYPPFPQHFQTVYSQPGQHQHGSVSNSSEYSIGGNSNGSVSSAVGSTLVEGGANGGGSISSMSGAPPSSLGKKSRSSIGGQGGTWFTTSSSNNPGHGGYVAPPPPAVGLGQDSSLHHHTHHPSNEESNPSYVTSTNYSGTT